MGGQRHAIQAGQAVPRLRKGLEAKGVEAGQKRHAVELVAGKPCVKSLLNNKAQGLPQGVEHRNRRGVVIGPLRMTSTARGPKETGDSPGGALRHFWVPL